MFRYTNRGEKVKVISEQDGHYIVRKVYVDDRGNEVLSDKSFITDELFDTPVKNWREYEIEKLEQQYQNIKTRCENCIKYYKRKQNIVKQRIKYLALFR